MIMLVEFLGPLRGFALAMAGLLFWFGGLALFYWYFRSRFRPEGLEPAGDDGSRS